MLNEEIRSLALDGSKAAVTLNFVAIEEGREVAFVSLDIFPPSQQPLVLYTLAVPTLLREKGIGSRVLAEVECLAKK
jgi:predicted N-acetyltransferase YhbS